MRSATSTITKLLRDPETRRTFLGYACIGVGGVSFYFLLLWLFVHLQLPPFFAFTLAYVIAVMAQFLMNKYLNFRAFDRAIHLQAGTYAVVTAVNYAVMIVIEEFGLHALRLNPLQAYALSIPFNLPIGYVANRFLTFGPGILAFIRTVRQRRV